MDAPSVSSSATELVIDGGASHTFGAVTFEKLANGSVTSEKIFPAAIIDDHIADNAAIILASGCNSYREAKISSLTYVVGSSYSNRIWAT